MYDVESIIPCRQIDEALAEELIKCQKALHDVQARLVTKYRQSEAYKMRKSFATQTLGWNNPEITHVVDNNMYHKFTITTMMPMKKVKTFIHESTVNVLLSGKLLTDAQKLVLANQITDGLFAESIPNEADAVVKTSVQEEYRSGGPK